MSWRSPENLLSLTQTLAIVGSACWVAYTFFGFEKQQHELEAQLLKHQSRQAETVVTESLRGKLRIEQSIVVESLPVVRENGSDFYAVTYRYEIENKGVTRKELTYVVVHGFVAELPGMNTSPAMVINSVRQRGPINWQSLTSVGNYYAPKWKESLYFKQPSGDKQYFLRGGGGTAELDEGERSAGSLRLILAAKPSDLIGFELRLGFDDGKGPDDRWRLEINDLLGLLANERGTDQTEMEGSSR